MRVGDDPPAGRAEPLERGRPHAVELVDDPEPVTVHPPAVLAHAADLDPVRRQHRRRVAGLGEQSHPQPQVPVLERGQRLVEATGGIDQRAADQRGDGRDEVAPDQLGEEPAVEGSSAVAEALRRGHLLAGGGRLDHRVAVRPADAGCLLEPGELFGELGGRNDVIGVEEREVRPAGRGDPRVPGRGQSPVRLPDDPHAGAVARQDGRGVVGRSVVDDHHVDATERLGERAVEGLAEESGVVERGDDEAHRHRTTS